MDNHHAKQEQSSLTKRAIYAMAECFSWPEGNISKTPSGSDVIRVSMCFPGMGSMGSIVKIIPAALKSLEIRKSLKSTYAKDTYIHNFA